MVSALWPSPLRDYSYLLELWNEFLLRGDAEIHSAELAY
jgi:hypothetical protein